MSALDDVCALKVCGHIRGEHGTEGRPFEPLSRTCLVEGCPCARFVEDTGPPIREGPPICPGCGRVMSNREAAEQAACNDCAGGPA